MGDDRPEGCSALSVELWTETCPVVAGSRSGDPLYPYKGFFPVGVVLGRGKLEKIEVARTKWEKYQGKLPGRPIAQGRGVPPDQHPRCHVENSKRAPWGRELAFFAKGRTNWRLTWS
jgi:hypothetical protein